jgi:hypothetical protein
VNDIYSINGLASISLTEHAALEEAMEVRNGEAGVAPEVGDAETEVAHPRAESLLLACAVGGLLLGDQPSQLGDLARRERCPPTDTAV